MATGTTSSVSAPAFHADDPEQTIEYRSLSVLAIISLVFGLASPLAFAAPLLSFIPVLGIALSILALRQIAVSDGIVAGRGAAMFGLVLCVVSVIAPFTRDYVLRSIREHQAKEFALDWIQRVTSGDMEPAFHLTVDGTRPQAPPPKGMPPEPGPPMPTKPPYQDFLDQPIIKQLKAVGPNANISFLGTREYSPTTFRNMVIRQRLAVAPASASGKNNEGAPIEIVVAVQRAKLPGEGASRWLIARCLDAKVADQSTPDR